MSEAKFDLRDALPVGTSVGDYKLESVLGHGGYSVVYQGRHLELGHVVALKEYLPADISVREGATVFPRSAECSPQYEDGQRRFLEEAKRIVQFKDDPGVVACLGYFRTNGTAYLVLEYIDGMSLAELLRRREADERPLDESELRSFVLPLLGTLSRLHKADVLHRDIKPSNILVRRSDGTPVLIDFGAAKQQATLNSKSLAPFTEGYAALEQVSEGELGPWTDVYAVGAVMWRIVAGGNPPWEPPNPKKVELRASAVLSGKDDPLPSATNLGRGRFSATILAAIDRSLAVLGEDRIPNCEELRDAVEVAKTMPGDTRAMVVADKSKVEEESPELSPAMHRSINDIFGDKRILQFSPNGPQIRPWFRLISRLIDMGILSIFVTLFAFICLRIGTDAEQFRGLMIMINNSPKITQFIHFFLTGFLMTFVESRMLSKWGFTIGKWMINARVTSLIGQRYLSHRDALTRSRLVWVFGLGLGLPVFGFIFPVGAWFLLNQSGATFWDKENFSTVLHRKIGFVRITGIFAVGIFLYFANIIALSILPIILL